MSEKAKEELAPQVVVGVPTGVNQMPMPAPTTSPYYNASAPPLYPQQVQMQASTMNPPATNPNLNNNTHAAPILNPPRIEIPLTHESMQVTCPFCHSTGPTQVTYEGGILMWLTVAGCCLFSFGCCAWIPCVTDFSKDAVHRCGRCNQTIGTHRII